MDDVESHRGLLFSIGYRMLGSAAHAEDLVQDAYVRFASADQDAIRDVKAFLATVVTRLALDRLKSARAQREEHIGQWLPEPVFTGRDADPFATVTREEAVQFALVAAMERLTPQERAVLLMSDVLDYGHDEIPEALDITAPSSRQLLHRARERVAAEKKRFRPSREEQQRLVETFMTALEKGNVDELREVLAADVVARGDGGGTVAGAGIHPILGFDNVSRLFLSVINRYRAVRVEFAEVNGAPSVVIYDDKDLMSIMTFDFNGGRIAEIDTVLNPEKLEFAKRQLNA